jgi:hypothetical protein
VPGPGPAARHNVRRWEVIPDWLKSA